MIKALGWFAAGYVVARYLILKNGVDTYREKENQIISKGEDIKEDFQEQYFEDQ